MSLLDKIILAFSDISRSSVDYGERQGRLKKAVAKRSHGSIRLQLGLFYTKEEADHRYERAKSLKL